MLSSAAAYRLRMLLAVMAATVVLFSPWLLSSS